MQNAIFEDGADQTTIYSLTNTCRTCLQHATDPGVLFPMFDMYNLKNEDQDLANVIPGRLLEALKMGDYKVIFFIIFSN